MKITKRKWKWVTRQRRTTPSSTQHHYQIKLQYKEREKKNDNPFRIFILKFSSSYFRNFIFFCYYFSFFVIFIPRNLKKISRMCQTVSAFFFIWMSVTNPIFCCLFMGLIFCVTVLFMIFAGSIYRKIK